MFLQGVLHQSSEILPWVKTEYTEMWSWFFVLWFSEQWSHPIAAWLRNIQFWLVRKQFYISYPWVLLLIQSEFSVQRTTKVNFSQATIRMEYCSVRVLLVRIPWLRQRVMSLKLVLFTVIFYNFFGDHGSFLWGHLYLYFRLQVMSALVFRARVYSDSPLMHHLLTIKGQHCSRTCRSVHKH